MSMVDKLIYLDNAATTWPKPDVVYENMDRYFRLYGANPGRASHRLAVEAERIIEGTRHTLARFLGLKEYTRLIFTFNCTDALNMAIKGLLRKGDHVITSSLEHNSVSRPLNRLEKEGFIEVTRIAADNDGLISVDDVEKAIKKNTRLLALTHASNVLGAIQDISRFGALCRKKNIVFLVDAAQTAGALPIDVEKDNIDLLAFSGHKNLFGPPGTGVLCVSDRVSLNFWREGGSGRDSVSPVQPENYPDRLEAGTLNFVGIAGLNAGINFILKEGREKIRQHEIQLIDRCMRALKKIPKVVLYGIEDPHKRVGLVSFNVRDARWDPPSLGSYLDQSFGILVRTGHHCAGNVLWNKEEASKGSIRISPGYFNTEEEVDIVCEKIKEAIA